MDTVYITGHRNPDTDSIVSAMAYVARCWPEYIYPARFLALLWGGKWSAAR